MVKSTKPYFEGYFSTDLCCTVQYVVLTEEVNMHNVNKTKF